jgi:hypothetical protein
MSEHQETLAALERIAAVLERLEAKLDRPVDIADGQRVLSLTEMAKRIRRRYAVARELAESGVIPGRCENGRWYFLPQDVEAYRRQYVDGAA